MKTKLLFAIAILMLAQSAGASSGCFADIGQSKFKRPKQELWHQAGSGWPASFSMRDVAYRVGCEQELTSGWSMKLAYTNQGSYTTKSLSSRDEVTFSYAAGMDRYVTKGSVQGVGISVAYKISTWQLEGGITYERREWSMRSDKLEGYIDRWNETQYGSGYRAQITKRFKSFNLAASFESGTACKFNRGLFPSGVCSAYMFTTGFSF
jgi:hypothetical protein